jgi:DnaK suppressor protein
LHKSLTARRDNLRKRIGGELTDLSMVKTAEPAADSADQAFDAASDEVAFQLAELESRELTQIEKALVRLRQGTYGVCEGCMKKIPTARLNALPFSTTCIACQREMEVHGSWKGAGDGSWDKVGDGDGGGEDHREIKLSDIEMDLTKG